MPDGPAGAGDCGPAQAARFRMCTRAQDRFIDVRIVINDPCAADGGHLASEANRSTPDSDIVIYRPVAAPPPALTATTGRDYQLAWPEGPGSFLHHQEVGLGGGKKA